MSAGTGPKWGSDDYSGPAPRSWGLAVIGQSVPRSRLLDRLKVDQIVIIGGALTWESQRYPAGPVTRPDRHVEARVSPNF